MEYELLTQKNWLKTIKLTPKFGENSGVPEGKGHQGGEIE